MKRNWAAKGIKLSPLHSVKVILSLVCKFPLVKVPSPCAPRRISHWVIIIPMGNPRIPFLGLPNSPVKEYLTACFQHTEFLMTFPPVEKACLFFQTKQMLIQNTDLKKHAG